MQVVSAESISAFQAAQLKNEVGTKVLSKSLDIARERGEAVVELLEDAVEVGRDAQPHRIDIKV